MRNGKKRTKMEITTVLIWLEKIKIGERINGEETKFGKDIVNGCRLSGR